VFRVFNEKFDIYQKLSAELDSQGLASSQSEGDAEWLSFLVSSDVPSGQCIHAVKSAFYSVEQNDGNNYALSIPSVKVNNRFSFSIRERSSNPPSRRHRDF